MTIADTFDRLLASHQGPRRPRLARAIPLEKLKLLAIDCETTGLAPRRDRLLSLAAIRVDGLDIDDRPALDSLVDPHMPVPAASTRIHGLTNARLDGAPTFAELFPTWRQASEGRLFVGHHVGFDLAIIGAEAKRCGASWEPPPFVDTARLARRLVPHLAHLDLADMLHGVGIQPQGERHIAVNDARMAAQLYVALAHRLAGRGQATFGHIHDLQLGD